MSDINNIFAALDVVVIVSFCLILQNKIKLIFGQTDHNYYNYHLAASEWSPHTPNSKIDILAL